MSTKNRATPALLKAPATANNTAAATAAKASKPSGRFDLLREIEASQSATQPGVRAGKQGRPVTPQALLYRGSMSPAEYVQMVDGVRRLDEAALRKFAEFTEALEEEEHQYGSLLDARKKSVQRKKWFVEAADDSAKATKVAEFVRETLSRGGWFRRFIYDALDAKGKGVSVLKKLYERGAGGWELVGAQHIPLSWLMTAGDGKTLLLRDADDPRTGVPLDEANFIVHSATRKSGLAIRGGLAIPVGALALAGRNGMDWWMELLEQYGMPFREAYYPDGTPYEDVLGLQAAMESMPRNGYVILKKGMEYKAHDSLSRGGSADAHKALLDYKDKAIAKLVAGVTEASEAGGGSNAKAQAQLEVRDDIVDADALELEETIQHQLLEPLIRMRFGDAAPMPVFKFHLEPEIPLDQFLSGVEKFVRMGGKVQMSVVRDRLQIAEPQDDSELLQPPAAGPSPFAGLAARQPKGGGCPVHSATAASTDADTIDELADEMLEAWDRASAATQSHILEAALAAGDPETRRARILEAVQTAPVEDLVALFATARSKTHAAGLAGGAL